MCCPPHYQMWRLEEHQGVLLQALLGKVYLYWADLDGDDPAKFDLAAQYLQEVVNSGQYALVDDFSTLFDYGHQKSNRILFWRFSIRTYGLGIGAGLKASKRMEYCSYAEFAGCVLVILSMQPGGGSCYLLRI